MLNASYTSIKFNEIEAISDYLAKKDIKRLYANLVYHLTLYQPNDPISFMLDNLRAIENNKESRAGNIDGTNASSAYYTTELKRPKIVFLIDSTLSQNSLLGREVALKYKFYYMQLNSLIEKEIYSESELGKALDQAIENRTWKDDKKVERDQKVKVLSKELEMNFDHEDFIVDGFPSRLEEALWFEKDICEPRLVLFIRQNKEPEMSDEEWMENQTRIRCIKEYFTSRSKWIEIEGENDTRSVEDVINDIDSVLV